MKDHQHRPHKKPIKQGGGYHGDQKPQRRAEALNAPSAEEQALALRFSGIAYLNRHIGGRWRFGEDQQFSAEFHPEVAKAIMGYVANQHVEFGVEALPAANKTRLTLSAHEYATLLTVPFVAKANPIADDYMAILKHTGARGY